jgi:hypothetical protein
MIRVAPCRGFASLRSSFGRAILLASASIAAMGPVAARRAEGLAASAVIE